MRNSGSGGARMRLSIPPEPGEMKFFGTLAGRSRIAFQSEAQVVIKRQPEENIYANQK